MQRRKDRVLGPYADGNGRYRVITITAPGEGQAEGTRRRSTFPTREEAEEYVAVAREEQAAHESVTIEDAIQEYRAHLAKKGDRQTTIDLTERFLRMFFPARDLLIANLTPARVQAQALLRWAVTQKLHKGPNPAAEIKPEGKRNRGKPQLRIDEGRRWLRVALEQGQTQPGALMAATALLLGCRAGELANCTVRDLDDGGAVLWLVGKTNEENEPRPVEVPDPLRGPLRALAAGRPSSASLFDRGPEVVAWWAKRICELAGLEIPPGRRAQLLRAQPPGHACHLCPIGRGVLSRGRRHPGQQRPRGGAVLSGGRSGRCRRAAPGPRAADQLAGTYPMSVSQMAPVRMTPVGDGHV